MTPRDTTDGRAQQYAWARHRYWQRVALGICTRCGGKRDGTRRVCAECALDLKFANVKYETNRFSA